MRNVRWFLTIFFYGLLWVTLFPQNGFSESTQLKPFVLKMKAAGRVLNAMETSDGNYLSVSRFAFSDSGGFVVTKRDPFGKKLWQTSFKVVDDKYGYSVIYALAETDDGYLIGGGKWVGDNWGAYSGLLIKLSHSGQILWKKSPGFYVTSFYTSRGGAFIAAGSNMRPFFWTTPEVASFSSNGDVLWARGYDTQGSMYGFASAITKDNHIVFATTHYDENDSASGVTLFKVSLSGNALSMQTLRIEDFDLISLTPTSDQGLILFGYGNRVVKLSKSGTMEWSAKYVVNEQTGDQLSFSHITEGADGYLLPGTLSANGQTDGILARVDHAGDLLFAQRFGRKSSAEAGEIVFTSLDGYVVLGSSDKNSSLMLRINLQGTLANCNYLQAVPIQRQAIDTSKKVKELRPPQRWRDSVDWDQFELTRFDVHGSRQLICR